MNTRITELFGIDLAEQRTPSPIRSNKETIDMLFNKALAEAIGTFTLVFIGCGAAVIAGEHIGFTGISFAFGLGLIAMAFAITPFVGQNYGADQIDRVRGALRFGIRFSVIWGVATAVVLAGGAGLLSRLLHCRFSRICCVFRLRRNGCRR